MIVVHNFSLYVKLFAPFHTFLTFQVMYVDRGCCRSQGRTSVEQLFHEWVDGGMVVRLDPWHFIHRFDAAVRTEAHPKYGPFKSALSAALFAYVRGDLQLVIDSYRAGHTEHLDTLTDEKVMSLYVTRHDLRHHVRRITVSSQETFRLVTDLIEDFKGESGQDGNHISLFKDNEAIDTVWEGQQRHLECLRDPPGMEMYGTKKYITRNGIRLPYYLCRRGNNSLEGFHAHLRRMIPTDRCAARPFQIYLLTGLARWNSERNSQGVKGSKGRQYAVYTTALVDRLNTRSLHFFGEKVEKNFQAPAPVGEDELIGLEFLFRQSDPEFSTSSHYDLATAAADLVKDEEEDEEPSGRDDAAAEQGECIVLFLHQGKWVTVNIIIKVCRNHVCSAL